MQRDRLADSLKGYACLLVLFGHVVSGIATSGMAYPSFMDQVQTFLWSFHIDLWMFLSGYVFAITGGAKKGVGRLQFIGKKILNLGIPYVVFSAVYIAINSFVASTNNQSSLKDILFIWRTPVAQYWFIYALFILFVLWAILSIFLKNWMITALLYIAFVLTTKVFHIDLGFADSAMNCVLAFGLGTCFRSLNSHDYQPWNKLSIIFIHILTVGGFILFGILDSVPGLDDVATILGILASIFFVSLITKSSIIERFLGFTCKYSFPIYLLHTIFTAATRIVLIKLGITNYILHIVVACVVGFVLPVIIGKITSLTPILDFFFYPTRSIKRIKKHFEK